MDGLVTGLRAAGEPTRLRLLALLAHLPLLPLASLSALFPHDTLFSPFPGFPYLADRYLSPSTFLTPLALFSLQALSSLLSIDPLFPI